MLISLFRSLLLLKSVGVLSYQDTIGPTVCVARLIIDIWQAASEDSTVISSGVVCFMR